MAFSIRIIGVPVQHDHPVWVVDHVYWWPVEDFSEKAGLEGTVPAFRESIDSTLYLDYIGIFNKEEFVRLNEGFKNGFLANPDKKPIHAEQQKLMNEVENQLKQHYYTKWLLVEQYEWESG